VIFPAWYSSARLRIAVLEAWPLTPGEALAHGVPLVASDIPSHREVAGGSARYYQPDHPRDLADAVRESLSGPFDRSRGAGRTWSEHARDMAETLVEVGRGDLR
jgi:alpha-1,2-rhamnosyltransferase